MRKGLLSLAVLFLAACAPQVTTKVDSGLSPDNPYATYTGPRAKVSVHVKTWDHPFRMDLRPRGWAGTHRRWSPWNSLPHSSTP